MTDRDRTPMNQEGPLSRVEAAMLIEEIRKADGAEPYREAMVNIIGSLQQLSENTDWSEYDISREEADELLAELDVSVARDLSQ